MNKICMPYIKYSENFPLIVKVFLIRQAEKVSNKRPKEIVNHIPYKERDDEDCIIPCTEPLVKLYNTC